MRGLSFVKNLRGVHPLVRKGVRRRLWGHSAACSCALASASPQHPTPPHTHGGWARAQLANVCSCATRPRGVSPASRVRSTWRSATRPIRQSSTAASSELAAIPRRTGRHPMSTTPRSGCRASPMTAMLIWKTRIPPCPTRHLKRFFAIVQEGTHRRTRHPSLSHFPILVPPLLLPKYRSATESANIPSF